MTTETPAPEIKTQYFGYGSNLWLAQMAIRCPQSKVVGLGILRGWKWFINGRGYANIVPSPEDPVYGMVYELIPSDVASLDHHEEVPQIYTKKTMEIESQIAGNVQALVYIDTGIVEEGEPKKKYVYRISLGISDAVARGLPRCYIDKYIRRFIVPGGWEEVVEVLGGA
ncbi:hypothetical protein BDM02DRAFT_3190294 [Thelephora ganbajun]|uniref:Uncharacterized protein n=1 Tax=Thelephora ganbajun TaxID=370292 RepID=A0ACB6Z5F4_THEGA|nr:hypothetical protein BDM02DRAFT_3190294 [Thelephora ganbajun]